MEDTLCPGCSHSTIRIVTRSDGSEESRCGVCGWTGPRCFGRLYEATNAKCAGGKDPTFWSGRDHDRKRCTYYDRCKEELLYQPRQQVEIKESILGLPQLPLMPTKAHPVLPTVSAPMQPVYPAPQQMPQAPVQQLGLQQVLAQRAAQQPTTQQPTTQQPAASYAQPYAQAYGQQGQQQGRLQPYSTYPTQQQPQAPAALVHPVYAPVPSMVPQNHVQPGAQMPSYLTVPEPYRGSFLPMLANTLMRAAFKGMFSQAANMMDHFPWGDYGPPG